MKNSISRAREMLASTRVAPGMWASTREAFLSRVTSIVEMIVEYPEFDGYKFYGKHLGVKGNSYIGADDPVLDLWAHTVVDDALVIIEKFENNEEKQTHQG